MPYKYKNIINLQLYDAKGIEIVPKEIIREIMHPDFGPGSIDFNAVTPMPPWARRNEPQQEKWMLEHWGVPANAGGLVETVRTYDGGATLEFDTEGSDMRGLTQKLSMMFPDIPGLMVDYLWASADVGKDTGLVQYQNGELTYEYIPESGSSAAFELAFDAFGTEAADHGLVFDADVGTYRYNNQVEEDAYEPWE